MDAEKVGLEADEIFVAAADVQDGFNADGLLDFERGDQGGQASACARAVGDVDGVDAGGGAEAGAGAVFFGVDAARGRQFDAGDGLLLGEFASEAAFLGECGRFEDGCDDGLPDCDACSDGFVGGGLIERTDGSDDLSDVVGGCAAAAADDAGAVFEEALGVFGHVFGGAHVEGAAFDAAGESGVGLDGDGLVGDGADALEGFEHVRGTE